MGVFVKRLREEGLFKATGVQGPTKEDEHTGLSQAPVFSGNKYVYNSVISVKGLQMLLS